MDGAFADFVPAVTNAELAVSGFQVGYEAVGFGEVKVGWEGEFTVHGQVVRLDSYPRFDNPYARVDIDNLVYKIDFGGMSLHLDFEKGTRTIK